tara:strand:+ start:248 stop:526 length:279 start_codon:yes stop_codon:yes gene_type:complete
LFIGSGANVNAHTTGNQTPLHFGIQAHQYEAVQLLLSESDAVRDVDQAAIALAQKCSGWLRAKPRRDIFIFILDLAREVERMHIIRGGRQTG